MTVRRNRWAASVPPGYFSSTKGHSALRKWSYAPTSRASAYESDIYYPEVYVKPRYYDTTREENDIRREVNSELIYTSNLLDDTYDIAARSRNRDQSLLREATRAVPSSTQPETKKTGALTPARRFQSRSTTVPPSILTKGPTTYPRLAPPLYRGTTNVQPLGILTNIDWTESPLTKFVPPGRIYEINDDDASEISSYVAPSDSARSSPERERGRLPRRMKGKLGPGRKVSKYYNRLVQRRAVRPSSNAKYYPYMDVESIASDDEDFASNGEYYNNDYPSNVSEAGSGEYIVIEKERSPSPIEYIPFGPSRRIDFSSGEYDCQVPSLSELSMSPYVPKSDIDSGHEMPKVKQDNIFHEIVARTASKARDALQNVNLDEYNDAALVISVEGEYKDPVKGENMGFHYIARPLTLKGPMLSTGPAMYASTASDSAFNRYMDDMASFRAQVRNRLEMGYKTLSEVSSKYSTHSYPIVVSSHRRYCRTLSPPRSSSPLPNRPSTYARNLSPVRNYSTESLPISNLKKRLVEIENKYKWSEYGKRLEEDIQADRLVVYPISERATVAAITAPETLPGHSKTVDLYQASAKSTELSTLEKINIKAALVGNKVEVTLPHRKRPKSSYAANKMRELKREEREYEVEAVPLQVTTGLKASSVTTNPFTPTKDYKPMSDVRRRVRRVICKNRGNPRYFKED